MLESYDDIRELIGVPPIWFDAHGVPRYKPFHPSMSVNVYADEVLLFEIACQECGELFLVEENWASFDRLHNKINSLSEEVLAKAVSYGDPPCFGGDCQSGATMSSDALRTVEFWSRLNDQHEWRRVPELEGVSLDDADDATR